MTRILAISPHPDDETLGCGGALLKHVSNGDEAAWLTMTAIFSEYGFSEERISSRKKEIEKVSEAYGFVENYGLDFPATKMDEQPLGDVIGQISGIVKEFKPEVIYLPFPGDAHSDHLVVFKAAIACVKTFRYPFVKSVRVYETISETDFGIDPTNRPFEPNLFMDISNFIDKKIEIMKMYEGEILPAPFPRSEETIRAQATVRGAVTGTSAAEAFMLIREIQ